MTKEKKLTDGELRILREVIWRRNAKLLPLIEALGAVPLTVDGREEIRGVLADELCETGLRLDDEPNERGRSLDSIIGRLMEF